SGVLLFLTSKNINENVYDHPFYVTVTEVNHNANEKLIEISCKMFTDDLEKELTRYSHLDIDLSKSVNKNQNEKIISEYVQKHLQIAIDGKAVALQFVGSENESDATWVYFQVNNITNLKRIDIINSLMFEAFQNETNLIHVMVGGKRQSAKLDKPETKASFSF
ncbi:MAG TPA: DUF6702 family protein, partial [Puia sp.]|nr:DUF6702 family protein [Puia sp.]